MRALAMIAAASTFTTLAHADKFDETLDVTGRGGGGWFELDELPLTAAPLDEPPALLEAASPYLTGTGRAGFVVMRMGLTLHGFRLGVGYGFMGVDGLTLHHAPIGMPIEPGRLWAMPFEGYVGYTFDFLETVRPYVEARGGVTVLQSKLELPGLGTTAYNGYAGAAGIAVGLLIPLGDSIDVDAGASIDVYGPMRLSLQGGLVLPIPLANL